MGVEVGVGEVGGIIGVVVVMALVVTAVVVEEGTEEEVEVIEGTMPVAVVWEIKGVVAVATGEYRVVVVAVVVAVAVVLVAAIVEGMPEVGMLEGAIIEAIETTILLPLTAPLPPLRPMVDRHKGVEENEVGVEVGGVDVIVKQTNVTTTATTPPLPPPQSMQ